MNRLTGKYALITGSSQGLGLQMAIAYAQEGAAGIAIVARGAELLEKARYLVQAASPTTKVLTIVADVSQPQDIERIVATTVHEFQGHIVGYPGWGDYGISKFGLEGLSQTWAAELAESNVRVNWVDPGNMNTAMHRAAEPDEDPTKWADPQTVTEIFIYLASDESKDIRGQRFHAQDEE